MSIAQLSGGDLYRLLLRALICVTIFSHNVPAKSRSSDERTPIILVSDFWCPFACEPGSNSPGYVIELTSKILVKAGYEPIYIATGFERATRNVEIGKWDVLIATNTDFTPELLLSSEMIVETRDSFFSTADSDYRVDGIGDLQGKMVGLIAGYDYGPEMTAWEFEHPDQVIRISSISPYERLLDLLTVKRVDLILEDHHAVTWWAKRRNELAAIKTVGRGIDHKLYSGFSPASVKGQKLKEAFDRLIPEIKSTSYHDQLLRKYGLMPGNHDR